jgi:electron transfer flavoprotein alpha subunit
MQTWVFAEETGGQPASTALEILTKARSFDGEVSAVYVGKGSDDAWGALGSHGATRVFHIDPGDALPAAGVAAAIADLAAERGPDLLLFGQGSTDRDVAGRLSARMDRPVISGAVDIAAGDDGVRVTNEILGGTTIVETAFAGDRPWIAVVRPKSFPAEPADGDSPEVMEIAMPDVGASGAATIIERHEEPASGPKLEEANIVVSGGRGMGSEESFGGVEELAGLLGAAVGATRAVVDAGWVPYSLQVGQTGKTVKPSVYLALGISGAMQHAVGMKDAGTIISVNKDEEAPIFGISDLGVVGDVHKVVPQLIEALKARG